jgi:preprotein translocase subunit YajC
MGSRRYQISEIQVGDRVEEASPRVGRVVCIIEDAFEIEWAEGERVWTTRSGQPSLDAGRVIVTGPDE